MSASHRFLKATALATILGAFSGERESRADGELPPVPAQSPFIPVILTEVGGDAPGPTQARLLESLSVALQRASLEAFSERIYGSSDDFTTRPAPGGALSIFATVMSSFDTYLEREISGVAANAPSGTFSVTVESLMARRAPNLPPAVDRLSGHPLRSLWQLGRIAAADQGKLSLAQVNVVDAMADLAVVAKADLPDGGASLYAQGGDVYSWVAGSTENAFTPLYERVTLDVNKGVVSVAVDVYVKPSSFYSNDFDSVGSPVATRYLTYLPPTFNERHPVVRVHFSRTYGGTNAQRPLLAVDFARMVSSDIRAINNCVEDCAGEINNVPTIAIDLQPSVINAHLQPLGGASSFWSSLDQGVENYFRSQLLTLVDWSEEETQAHTRLFVLLNSIVIDLEDPAGPAVRPDLSQTPVVLRITAPFTGDLSYVTFNSYNTTVTAETDLSYLHLGEGRIGGSINLFEKYIGPNVSSHITDGMRTKMRNLDRSSDGYLANALAPVTNLIKTGAPRLRAQH